MRVARLLRVAGALAVWGGAGCGSSATAGGNDAAKSDAPALPSPDDASSASDVVGTADGPGVIDADGDAGALVARCEALAMAFAHSCATQVSGGVVTPDTARTCMWTTYAQICRTGRTELLLDSMLCFGEQNPSCWIFSDSNSAAACLDGVHAAAAPPPALGAFFQQVCTACDAGIACTSADASAMYVAEANAGRSELLPYVSDEELGQIAACATSHCPANIAMNCASLPDVAGTLNCK